MVHVIILGFILMAGAGTVAGLLIADNHSRTPIYTPQLVGHVLPSVSAIAIFCAGIGLALLFCLGVWAAAGGLADRRRADRSNDPVDDFLPGEWRAS
jgi:hypothetical protein